MLQVDVLIQAHTFDHHLVGKRAYTANPFLCAATNGARLAQWLSCRM
jgi:hypothetical protein